MYCTSYNKLNTIRKENVHNGYLLQLEHKQNVFNNSKKKLLQFRYYLRIKAEIGFFTKLLTLVDLNRFSAASLPATHLANR